MTSYSLIMRYAAFALLATLANLAVQRLILSAGSSAIFFTLAVAGGTAAGLIVKYVLDKRWIFFDMTTGLKAHGHKFTLYTAMGVITTGIFWSTETFFWIIWKTDAMRETGAVLGLLAGYLLKYNLDRRFVFSDSRLSASR